MRSRRSRTSTSSSRRASTAGATAPGLRCHFGGCSSGSRTASGHGRARRHHQIAWDEALPQMRKMRFEPIARAAAGRRRRRACRSPATPSAGALRWRCSIFSLKRLNARALHRPLQRYGRHQYLLGLASRGAALSWTATSRVSRLTGRCAPRRESRRRRGLRQRVTSRMITPLTASGQPCLSATLRRTPGCRRVSCRGCEGAHRRAVDGIIVRAPRRLFGAAAGAKPRISGE
jgi:hypothetical protein